MHPNLSEIYPVLDARIAKSMRESGVTPPCKSGCFYCCKEPVYASLTEMRYLLEQMTPEEIEELKEKVRDWHERFTRSGFHFENSPNAFEYRAMNIWCPLLKEGKCSVYDRRPFACRSHFAYASADGCKDDELRKTAKFAVFPNLDKEVFAKLSVPLTDGESETLDHLGIVLMLALFGGRTKSMSQIRVSASGQDLMIERFED